MLFSQHGITEDSISRLYYGMLPEMVTVDVLFQNYSNILYYVFLHFHMFASWRFHQFRETSYCTKLYFYLGWNRVYITVASLKTVLNQSFKLMIWFDESAMYYSTDNGCGSKVDFHTIWEMVIYEWTEKWIMIWWWWVSMTQLDDRLPMTYKSY